MNVNRRISDLEKEPGIKSSQEAKEVIDFHMQLKDQIKRISQLEEEKEELPTELQTHLDH